MTRLRLRAAGATHRVDADLAAPAAALRLALGLPPSAAFSLDARTPLPPDTPLAEAGVRPGDLLHVLGGSVAAAGLVPSIPPPRRRAGPPPPPEPVVRAVAALPPSAPAATIAAMAAAAAAVELGCRAAWSPLTPLAPPPGWAPPAPLRVSYAGVPIVIRAMALGSNSVVVVAGVEAAPSASTPRRPHPPAFRTTLTVPRDVRPGPDAPRLSSAAYIALADRIALPAATAAAASVSADPPASLLTLPAHVTQTHVLPHLAGADLGALACAGSRALWGAVTDADAVWRARHAADHGGPPPSTAASPYAAYAAAARAAAAVRRAAARPNSLGWGGLPPRRLAVDPRRPRGGGGGGVWGGDYDRLAPGGLGGGGGPSFGGGGAWGARGGLPLRGGRWQPPPF